MSPVLLQIATHFQLHQLSALQKRLQLRWDELVLQRLSETSSQHRLPAHSLPWQLRHRSLQPGCYFLQLAFLRVLLV